MILNKNHQMTKMHVILDHSRPSQRQASDTTIKALGQGPH